MLCKLQNHEVTITIINNLIERCVTYVINDLGQKYMRRQIEVFMYGEPENLHPNLQNSLTNLCKRLTVYENYAVVIPINNG